MVLESQHSSSPKAIFVSRSGKQTTSCQYLLFSEPKYFVTSDAKFWFPFSLKISIFTNFTNHFYNNLKSCILSKLCLSPWSYRFISQLSHWSADGRQSLSFFWSKAERIIVQKIRTIKVYVSQRVRHHSIYGQTHWSRYVDLIWLAFVYSLHIFLFSFEYLPFVTTTNLCPLLIFGSGLNTSAGREFNGPTSWNSCTFRLCLPFASYKTGNRHSLTPI